MSKKVRENCDFINFMTTFKRSSNQFKSLLATLTPEQVNVISEIAANVLYGVIPISGAHKNKLKPFKSILVGISEPKNSVSKRQDILIKRPTAVIRLLHASKPFLKCVVV